ncbi:hypothetical protein F4820DRAFT_453709 [Hypoxylon rubiginosum]|uniref:Uncharacterized protein n=1 Tax=Hypoxylon rubiginosum TaxID=110542 RepID=A0ACB9YJV6_9PEZI|nr:hypothetical protein F4820DRAFT_453709 [Hypoxylon rubiginosum]
MSPVPTPYENPWETDNWTYNKPSLDQIGQFFLYPGRKPASFTDEELTSNKNFTPPPLDEQYILVVEDVEVGSRNSMVWDVPRRTWGGRAIKDQVTNRTIRDTKTGRFPVQFGWTVLDTRDVLKEVKKDTKKSGLKAKIANTPPGRFGRRWMELGIVRVYDVVVKEYMKDYHPDRNLTGWKRKIAPYIGAFVETKQVELKNMNNYLEGFWTGLENRNLTEQEKAVGYKRKIVMAAWAWDAERTADMRIGKAFWARAHSIVDLQKWTAYTKRADHDNNGKSLSFVCDKLGVPHHDGDGRDLCHEACNDSFLTMMCVLATLFVPPDAANYWLVEEDLEERKPPKGQNNVDKRVQKNEAAYKAGSSGRGPLYPPRNYRK